MRYFLTTLFALFTITAFAQPPSEIVKSPGGPLLGTAKLDWEGDVVAKLVADADAFFLNETFETVKRQESFWNRDLSSVEAYEKSLETNRKELARILGVVDVRVEFEAPEKIDNLNRSAVVLETDNAVVYAIRWPVFDDYVAEGLLILPKDGVPNHVKIVIPDADETPEDCMASCGIFQNVGDPDTSFIALIPTTVSRSLGEFSAPYPNSRVAVLTNREYLYRTAFEM